MNWKGEGSSRQLYAKFRDEPHIFELNRAFALLIPYHPIQWRSPRVFSFNPFNVTAITRSKPGEKLVLKNENGVFTATREGKPVPLDQSLAIGLRNRLASLETEGWILNAAEGYKLLEKPYVTFLIESTEMDRAIGQARKFSRTLKLVRSEPKHQGPLRPGQKPPKGIVYGQVDGSLDIFVINSEKTFKPLIQPLTGGSLPVGIK